MKMLKKSILIFGAVLFLVSASSLASAVTDGTGDIYHGIMTNNSWSYVSYSEEKANIDIKSVDYSISGSEVTVTLTVSGSIQVSNKTFYSVYLSVDEGKYSILYGNNYTTWFGLEGYAGEGGGMITNFTVSGNTLTATFTPAHPSNSFSILCIVWEVVSASQNSAEWFLDYTPDASAPWYTAGTHGTNNQTTTKKDKGIPGFEAITIFAAIGVALILLRRKK